MSPFWSGGGGGLQERDIEVEVIAEPLTRWGAAVGTVCIAQ